MKQTLKYIYGMIFDNMKFAEAKHNIVLTLASAVIAFATTFFSSNLIQNVFAIFSIIFSLIAILYSFVALVAKRVRIKSKKQKQTYNLLNYRDIIRFDEKTYVDTIITNYEFTKVYKPDNMDYNLAKQIIVVAKLAWLKFIYFNFAVLFLIASIISIIVAVLIRGNLW